MQHPFEDEIEIEIIVNYIRVFFKYIDSVEDFFLGKVDINDRLFFTKDEQFDALFTDKVLHEFYVHYKKIKVNLKILNLFYLKNNIVNYFFYAIGHSEQWAEFCNEKGINGRNIERIKAQFVFKLVSKLLNLKKKITKEEAEKAQFFGKINSLLAEDSKLEEVIRLMEAFCSQTIKSGGKPTYHYKLLKKKYNKEYLVEKTTLNLLEDYQASEQESYIDSTSPKGRSPSRTHKKNLERKITPHGQEDNLSSEQEVHIESASPPIKVFKKKFERKISPYGQQDYLSPEQEGHIETASPRGRSPRVRTPRAF